MVPVENEIVLFKKQFVNEKDWSNLMDRLGWPRDAKGVRIEVVNSFDALLKNGEVRRNSGSKV